MDSNVYVPLDGKRPYHKEWQHQKSSKIPGKNIGLHLGPSGVIDIDLDCGEAVRLASLMLPPGVGISRGGKITHLMYRLTGGSFRRYVYKRETLVEFRTGKGIQTMIPPSVHPSGEPLTWVGRYSAPPPPRVEDLAQATARLAAASLLLRYGCSLWRAATIAQQAPQPLDIPDEAAACIRLWLGWAPARTQPASQRYNTVTEACQAYLRDNPPDYPRRGGACPICESKRGFRGGVKGGWVCWSTSHASGGKQANDGHWYGDRLDLDAAIAERQTLQHLRACGYL